MRYVIDLCTNVDNETQKRDYTQLVHLYNESATEHWQGTNDSIKLLEWLFYNINNYAQPELL